ncbi:MAG: polymer-forming cytoskeletal protein [Halomonas sp.]|nr:polymer-forming cytoskeletal protein [Halomonas sp.]TVP52364.1 MAG: polymer-forming cytoskeletal protein [Halomonas sp.]
MGIQAWFIVLGVGVMTLIVWDGRRCKVKQRSSAVSDAPLQAQAVSEPLYSQPALKDESGSSKVLATLAAPTHEPSLEGSRIGLATHIAGRVIADEPVHIKGRIEGSVIAPNHPVSVTTTGHVSAYIEGNYVDIDGHVFGGLRANTKATLLSGAHVHGTVDTPRLECMAGAWLQADVMDKAAQPRVAMLS